MSTPLVRLLKSLPVGIQSLGTHKCKIYALHNRETENSCPPDCYLQSTTSRDWEDDKAAQPVVSVES